MPVVRQLVFVDADEAFNLRKDGLITVERGDVDSGEADREVRVGSFRCQVVPLPGWFQIVAFSHPGPKSVSLVKSEVCVVEGGRGL